MTAVSARTHNPGMATRPWPKFITPGMDPQPMRPDTPRPASADRTNAQLHGAPHMTAPFRLNTARVPSHPIQPLAIPDLARCKVLAAACLKSDGSGPKSGYRLRLKTINGFIATHNAADKAALEVTVRKTQSLGPTTAALTPDANRA